MAVFQVQILSSPYDSFLAGGQLFRKRYYGGDTDYPIATLVTSKDVVNKIKAGVVTPVGAADDVNILYDGDEYWSND